MTRRKKLLDKLLGSRILWLIVSLVCAVLLWIYVATNEQLEREVPLNNVRVVFVGEEALRERGFVITNIDTLSVNLVVRGSGRTVLKLSSTNVTAQIDVSSYNRSHTVERAYEIVYPTGVDKSEITYVEKNIEIINFAIDQIVRKSVDVKVETNGTYAQDYINEEPVADPQTVWLSGASEELRNVDYALVNLEFDNLSHTIEGDYSYTLIDNEGSPIEYAAGQETTIVREQESVFVRLPILMMKDIYLAVDFIEGGGATGVNAETRVSPEFVRIAGDPEVLKGMNRIVLGTVDLATFVSTYEREYDIKYPDNVVKISGEEQAKAEITIRGLETRKITTNNISVIGIPDGYQATLVTNILEVTVRGPQAIISQIQPENIRVVVDLAEGAATTPGTRSLVPQISIDGYPQAGVVYQAAYMVVVSIGEKTADAELDGDT